ncbi:MAG: NTP transferase domain-containing protein [Deltaproteobacteria bacterium]|nr:NTP transferase domain-containing protein [Deltaproteobacteria bacterium]
MQAVILAAGMGRRFRHAFPNIPKSMAPFGDRPLLAYSLDALAARKKHITKIHVVVGYMAEQIIDLVGRDWNGMPVSCPRVFEFANTGSAATFLSVAENISDDLLVLDGDLIYEDYVLDRVLEDSRPDVMAVTPARQSGDEVWVVADRDDNLVALGKDKILSQKARGEMVGINKLSRKTVRSWLRQARREIETGRTQRLFEDTLGELASQIPITCLFLENLKWWEIDTPEDYRRALALHGLRVQNSDTVGDL